MNEIWQRILAGGTYMVPILALSVLMFSLIAHKTLELWTARKQLRNGEDALPFEHWLRALHRNYLFLRSGIPDIDAALAEALASSLSRRMRAGIALILLCSVLEPLLGLLGTVSGMIVAFDVMSLFGAGNTKGVAAGISEALITTQSGLMVAVPGLVAGKMLMRMEKHLHGRISVSLRKCEERAAAQQALRGTP